MCTLSVQKKWRSSQWISCGPLVAVPARDALRIDAWHAGVSVGFCAGGLPKSDCAAASGVQLRQYGFVLINRFLKQFQGFWRN